VRVVTWNLWQYSAPWSYAEPRGVVAAYPAGAPRLSPGALWARRRTALLAALERERPDVILLQECGRDEEIAPGAPNQSRQIADALGYAEVYTRASVSRRRPAEHGQAALAGPGWTIRGHGTLDLPHAGMPAKDASRIVLRADLSGPDGAWRVINAHFSLNEAARGESVERRTVRWRRNLVCPL